MKKYIQSAEGLTSKQRAKIAKNSTDPKELKRLAYDNAKSVRLAVLDNPNTPDAVVQMLCNEFVNDRDVNVREVVAGKTDDPNILVQFANANDDEWYLREAVAKNPNVTEEILAQLANDRNPDVRQAVAKKTDDPNILAQLANDDHWFVRTAVAEKTDDPNLLDQFANDDDWVVRKAVVRKTDDSNILAQFANDDNWSVRKAVAKKTDDPDVLAQIANDDNWVVRTEVAENPNTTSEILAQLAGDRDLYVRKDVVKHPNTSAETLAQLENDKNADVRKAAAKRLKDFNLDTSGGRRKSSPKTDWSIPLYSITEYSAIENEIDQVIDQAANQYSKKYFGGDAVVNIPDRAYDNGGQITIHFNSPEGGQDVAIDAEDLLAPATSQNLKKKCVQAVVKWFEANI